jgi:uncharacterized protein YjbI with pentapeptide repeats
MNSGITHMEEPEAKYTMSIHPIRKPESDEDDARSQGNDLLLSNATNAVSSPDYTLTQRRAALRLLRAVLDRTRPSWQRGMHSFRGGRQWLKDRQQAIFVSVSAVFVLLLIIYGNLTAAVAAAAALVALTRHFAQTDADRQRRISDNYSRAMGQLASEKTEERVAAIYTLERVARESLEDYWPIMETLTSLVRERQWTESAVSAQWYHWTSNSKDDGDDDEKLPREIAVALTVLGRRPRAGRVYELQRGLTLDLRGVDLRGAELSGAHFERSFFAGARLDRIKASGAHFEGAKFVKAHLQGASLHRAHIEEADLMSADLQGAYLSGVYLKRAKLWGTNFQGAILLEADFEGASSVLDTNFGGADLRGANLKRVDLRDATADSKTRLPSGFARPAHWPSYVPPRTIELDEIFELDGRSTTIRQELESGTIVEARSSCLTTNVTGGSAWHDESYWVVIERDGSAANVPISEASLQTLVRNPRAELSKSARSDGTPKSVA